MLDKHKEDQEYMGQLYNRFVESLKSEKREYFEKEELLNIYDYAQDEGDDMTQMQVIIAASALFPHDDFLDERHAFFLSTIDSQAALRFRDLKPRPDTMLWNMLDFTIQVNAANAAPMLEQLLKKQMTWDSESVIRLFDTLQEIGRQDLVVMTVGPLQSMAEFPNHMLFEAAENLSHNREYWSQARDISEELTKREPFTFDNWMLLAKIEYAMGHIQEALSAAEYALAIDPDNSYALMLKAGALVPDKSTRPQGIEILVRQFQKTPYDVEVGQVLAEAYRLDRKKKMALAVFNTLIDNVPGAASYLLPDIMRLRPTHSVALPFLKKFEAEIGNYEEAWLKVIENLEESEHVDMALVVADYYNEHYGFDDVNPYIALLYRANRYEDVLNQFMHKGEQSTQNPGTTALRKESFLFIVASLLMTKHYGDVISMTNMMLEPSPRDISSAFSTRLEWQGMQSHLLTLRYLAKHPEYIQDSIMFDPLELSERDFAETKSKKRKK